MKEYIQNDKDSKKNFAVTNRVKQRCVLVLALFSLYLTVILEFALRESQEGIFIKIKHRFD